MGKVSTKCLHLSCPHFFLLLFFNLLTATGVKPQQVSLILSYTVLLLIALVVAEAYMTAGKICLLSSAVATSYLLWIKAMCLYRK